MKVNLTDRQMLELWRQGAGLEPAFSDASTERFDSLDVDSRLRRAMRGWYLDYLRTAPEPLVPVTELKQYAVGAPGPASDQWTLTLTCPCARILSIDIEGIGRLRLIHPDDGDEIRRPLRNRFVRHGSRPTAYLTQVPGVAIVNIESAAEPKVTSLQGVMITADDVYLIDESMLAAIPTAARGCLDNIL